MKKRYYEKKGQGYPLVCIHDTDNHMSIFDEFINNASQDYQCICIDNHYLRQSKMNYQQILKEINEIIKECGLNEYDVIGVGDGAYLALKLAIENKNVSHLVLVSPYIKKEGIKLFYRFYYGLMLLCLLPFCLYNKKMRKKWLQIKMKITIKEISQEQLQHISIPTLIINGEHDLITNQQCIDIKENLKYSLIKKINDGYHPLLVNQSKNVSNEITTFLKICHERDK